MEQPHGHRKRERKAHRTKLILKLDNGTCIEGYSGNVSLSGLFLTPDQPVTGIESGMSGIIQADPNPDNLSFSCQVARVSDHGIGIIFKEDRAAFGMFITHDMILDLLTGINNFFAYSMTLEETLKTGVDRIKDYLEAEAASLFLLENDDQDIICHACAGPVDITGMRLEPGEGIVGRTILDGHTLIVNDARNDSRFAAHVDEATGFETQSILSAPLIIKGRTIGAMEVLNRHGNGLFAGHDRVVLAVLASATAMAIQNARNADRFIQDKRDEVIGLENQVNEKIKDLEDKKQREITILDSIADAVITIDKAGTITMFNVAAGNMFGYQADELIGKNVAVLLPQDERTNHDKYIANSKLHGPRIINKVRDLEGLRKDNSRFPLELNVTPINTDDEIGFIGVLRDITDRKKMDQKRDEEAGQTALMYAIGTAATQCHDLETMYRLCLDEICSFLQWPVGHVYLRSKHDGFLLETTPIWHLKDEKHLSPFRVETDRTQFKVGEGMPGTAALWGRPVWIEDVTRSENFSRIEMAKKCGIRSGLAIPVIVDDQVISVLEFFSTEAIPNNTDRDRALSQITHQIGQSASRISAELALGESEKRFRGIVENAGDAIYIHDRYGKIYDVNQNACTELGYNREELLSLTIADLEASLDMDGLRDTWDVGAADPDKYPITLEGVHRRKDGSTFPMEVRLGVLDFNSENMFIAVVRNVTARKVAEEENRLNEERFRDFTSTASDWVWEMGPDLKFSHISDRFFELFPIDKSAIIGKTRWEYADRAVVERDPEIWQQHKETLEQHLPFRNFYYRTGDAETGRHISLNGNPVFNKDGSFAGYRGTGADVTELRKMQENMIRAKEEAETANMAKSGFLSSMSHELRTPLNAILGFGQMLQYNPKEPLTESQQTSVEYILKGGEHLLDLINDVLDLAKIEAGKVELSIENIASLDIITECRELVDEMAAKRHITITTPDAGQNTKLIRADYTRVKQVCLNLMSNAIKYNLEGGSISISLEEVNAGLLRFSVSDTGPGIPLEKQSGLFTAFNRLGAENSDIEGTGIGLVVSRDLIEMMEGKIGFDSTEGVGSTFWFELPLCQNQGDEQAASVKTVPSGTGEHLKEIHATMLYVEDNPSNLQLMELITSRVEGLEMISAHTAELGIDLAKSKLPDIIILDINLPGMNGFEALKILQNDTETRTIPVLALSANATRTDIENGEAAGFLKYLTKPIKVTEITDAIELALKSRVKS